MVGLVGSEDGGGWSGWWMELIRVGVGGWINDKY